MTELMVRRVTAIAEDNAIITRIGSTVTDVALRRKKSLRGSPPLDVVCGFG